MRAFERGRGHDIGYVPGARSREPDVPSRTPEQAAEADVARLRDDVSILAKQVDVAIDRCASLPEWNEEKDKLTEKVQALRNRIQGRNLKALSEKTEKAAADYKEAETTLRAIEGRLAEPRQLRAVPPVAGEVAIEESVVARAVDLDELFLWAAQLPVRHREALKDRFAKPSTADHFVRELQNYLAAARVYFEFKDILDGKKLRREVRERVLAKRRAALDSRRDDPLHDHRGAEDDATGSREANPVEIAERGVAGASDPLPHVQTLQPLFGHHDLSKVKAQVGGPAAEAARALGAKAYTVGERVGFASAPDLQLAAHEAAHVIEQRAAVARKGAVDTGGSDPGEVLADAIADAAGRGEPVEAQLDHVTSTSRPVAAVHRKRDGEESARPRPTALGQFLNIHEAGLRNELVAYLRDARWPDPASDVRFAPGGERRFTMSLVGAVASKLTDAEALQRLVSPANLSERFRRYVDLKHANDARAFGIALAQLVQWAARDALIERVGPRYRMLWASRFEPPDADELCGAHPMDLLVARALTTEGVVDLREMPAADAQVATVPPVAQMGGHGTRKKRHPHDHGSNAKDAEAPTVTQLMAIERDIGTRLDAIRDQVARLEFADELREAYDARADRVALLADADEATRARYLPVLQFQHAQLITISRPLPQVVSRYWPLRGLPDFALTPQRRAERDELVQLLTTYVRAAATSHDKERSTAILRQIAIRERQAQRDQIDAAQVQAILDTRDVVENTRIKRQPAPHRGWTR